MNRRALILRTALLLAVVWAVVAGIRLAAANQKPSAEKIARAVDKADFADWSGQESGNGTDAKRREKDLRKIAAMFNELDFRERERGREMHLGEDFFPKLSREEKRLFIDLTVSQSMNRMMEALDAMPEKERRKFVKQGLEEIAEGRTEQEMLRARDLGDDLVARMTREGMRAYYEKASIDTKLDLAPLMEAMNEVMQGLRGREFGDHHR